MATRSHTPPARKDPRPRVLVTVSGGVAETKYDESQVLVEVIDYDEYETTSADVDAALDRLTKQGFPDPRQG